MDKKVLLPVVFILVLGAFTIVGALPQDSGQKATMDKSQCLACHGPYDDIAAATADYEAKSGEIATPHQYVPHAEKEEENIPECTECHEPHAMPPEGEVAKPDNIDWCYSSCHHANNLQSCNTCH